MVALTAASHLQVAEVEQREAWNSLVVSLPTGHVLQSWEWGELKRRYEWQPTRLAFYRGGEPKAAVSLLERRLPLARASLLYAPKGPCLDPADQETLREVLRHLRGLARDKGAVFLKVDPDIEMERRDAVAALEEEGFAPSLDQIQYRNTIVLDLTPPVEELRSRLRADTRYSAGYARRKGVEIRQAGAESLSLFYSIYQETAERGRFLIRPYNYYEAIWRTFLDRDMGALFLAEHEGEALAGAFLLLMGEKAWYMYGASRSAKRQLKPNHLLQWEAILWAKQQRCTLYDMWGLPNVLAPDQPMWGVVQFKTGFGGEVRRWVGAYDYTARPLLYRLWLRGVPRSQALLRWLLRKPSATQAPGSPQA